MQGAYDMHSMHNEHRHVQPPLFRATGRDNYGELKMQQIVAEQKASFSRGEDQYRKYHFESTLTYDRLFGRDHRTSGLVYFYLSDQQRSSDGSSGRTAIPVRYQGLSSRLTYNFRDTYMLDVNFGYTGSENFQPGRQYGFFPSIAGGWIPTNYDLVKKLVPWLNFLKIRGSYGVVGNDRLAGNRRFPYQTLVNEGRIGPWGSNANVEFVHVGVIGADNLEWEKAMKADLGIEGRFWKDKISFVVDFFSDMRNGIFQPRVQVPYYAGLVTQAYGNIGKMRSFGADGNLDYKESINKDMSFIIRANFTYSRNMIYNWEQLYERYPYLEQTGYPHGSIRGYRSLGLFKDEDDVRYSPRQNFGDYRPGDIKYMDVNGDGRINGEDVVPLSRNTFPMIMYGFGGEFRYKEFTIGVMLKGTGKTDYFRVGQGNGMGYIPFYNGESGNVLTIAADPRNRWIPRDYIERHGMDPALAENPNAIFPRLQYGYNNNNSQLSDFWKGNSSYIRLQEITLNYHLKKDFLRRASISSVDIQLVGTNLYTWDSVKLFDPEQAVSNGRAYPLPAVYTLQFYINF